MKPRINLISLITNQFDAMMEFYKDVLDFEVVNYVEGHYVEFKNEGVRFAISTNEVMADATGHKSFQEPRQGQVCELAFKIETPGLLESAYQDLIAKGATHVQSPADMPRGQKTAFFADPDGNIHELFAELNM